MAIGVEPVGRFLARIPESHPARGTRRNPREDGTGCSLTLKPMGRLSGAPVGVRAIWQLKPLTSVRSAMCTLKPRPGCSMLRLLVAQGDLVRLGDVLGLDRSESLAQALAGLPQQLERVGGGAPDRGAI